MEEPEATCTGPLANAEPPKAKSDSDGISNTDKGAASAVASPSDSNINDASQLSAPVTIKPPIDFTDQPQKQDRQRESSANEDGDDYSADDSAVDLGVDPQRPFLSGSQSPAQEGQGHTLRDCGQTVTLTAEQPGPSPQLAAARAPESPPSEQPSTSPSDSQQDSSPENPVVTPPKKTPKRPKYDKKKKRRRRRQARWEDEFYVDSMGKLAISRDEQQNQMRLAQTTNPECCARLAVCSWRLTRTAPLLLGDRRAGGEGVPALKVTDPDGEEWFLENPGLYLVFDDEEDVDWLEHGDGEEEGGC